MIVHITHADPTVVQLAIRLEDDQGLGIVGDAWPEVRPGELLFGVPFEDYLANGVGEFEIPER